MNLTIGVNFINILLKNFLYKSALSSFLQLCFCFAILWRKDIGTKAASKILMKFITGVKFHQQFTISAFSFYFAIIFGQTCALYQRQLEFTSKFYIAHVCSALIIPNFFFGTPTQKLYFAPHLSNRYKDQVILRIGVSPGTSSRKTGWESLF